MYGKLTVIGVGPGDPELITLKGLRILKETGCIIVPKGREEGSSLALSIVSSIVDLEGKEIVEAYFPMRKTRSNQQSAVSCQEQTVNLEELDNEWNRTVESVSDRLKKGIDIVFITIGDPTIYSTFYYLHERLTVACPGAVVEIVPGVSSINASAARAGIYLGIANEKIAILPANYMSELKNTLEHFDTVVLMKVNKVFKEIMQALDGSGLTDRAVYVCRTGMKDEKIFHDIREVTDEDLSYFSMVIVKK